MERKELELEREEIGKLIKRSKLTHEQAEEQI